MAYSIQPADTSKPAITINPLEANTSETSLTLHGFGKKLFGEAEQTNFYRLLENHASPTAPVNPIEGQMWYDTSLPSNKQFKVWNGAKWVKVLKKNYSVGLIF